MRSRLLSMGMLAGLLAFGLVMFGCDHNPRPWNGEPGPVDSALVGGTWYYTGEEEIPNLQFSNNGTVTAVGQGTMPCTALDNIIKINNGGQIITGTYSISESTLTVSIPGFMNNATFSKTQP